MCVDLVDCHSCVCEGDVDISWVEAGDALPHPTSTGQLPVNKELTPPLALMWIVWRLRVSALMPVYCTWNIVAVAFR